MSANHPTTTCYRIGRGEAIALADHIDGLIAGKSGGMLDLDINFAVTRVGTGIKIENLAGGSRVVSRDVARDVAGVIRRTVSAKLRNQVADKAL